MTKLNQQIADDAFELVMVTALATVFSVLPTNKMNLVMNGMKVLLIIK